MGRIALWISGVFDRVTGVACGPQCRSNPFSWYLGYDRSTFPCLSVVRWSRAVDALDKEQDPTLRTVMSAEADMFQFINDTPDCAGASVFLLV